jgi:hypothetical protein
VLGGGGEAIWGSGEDWKLTRRLVHNGAIRAGKHDGNGAVRLRGLRVPGLGSTKAVVHGEVPMEEGGG